VRQVAATAPLHAVAVAAEPVVPQTTGMTARPSSGTQSVYRGRAKLWRWAGGKASWYFITLPSAIAREIRLVDAGPRRVGFGALRVQATIGDSCWLTSIFPATGVQSYLLPVKAAVRKAESLAEGKMVAFEITVRRAG
jgi:hypothetical protein